MAKNKRPVPTVLDKILAQQKKGVRTIRIPVRTARLYMNGDVLAIGLNEDAVEMIYCPASAPPNPFEYMARWVQLGEK